ncbi:hypothetical protein LTR70_002874 [Exophiala xenobiotica]|uniref:Methyltransferase domain-containing protein n=1 Tax=Lithohypha guttulata TaxID=1690604 RepID=A0ABR0KI19_9EURO|nr:hypothetical protein LTR24_002518 [Lithohypha guttulata]KAK5324427.1 hypothetical protein LTR70_002874 [Exophiala xenobiotica]
MSTEEASQPEMAKKILWSDPGFAAHYKSMEELTGGYAHDLCIQMGLQSYSSPIHFLDLACGTGIVTKRALAILQTSKLERPFSEDKFTFADISSEMLKVIRSRVIAEKWPLSEEAKNIQLVEANMTDTKLPSDTYTHLGCSLGPAVAPHPDHTLGESYRMLRPGGIAGWTGWQHIAWLPDMARALKEIREDALAICAQGNGIEEDRKLSKLPDMVKGEDMIARFAGVDLNQLRADGVREADLPRWDKEEWFRKRVETAGFVDVKVSIVKKDFSFTKEEAYIMIKHLIVVVSTFWTERQREEFEGTDLRGRVKEWFDHSLDVKEDGKVHWKGWQAMVITARKPQ